MRPRTSDLGSPRLRPTPPAEAGEARILELAERWLRGDREAAAALWDHFAPLVRGLLARALGTGDGLDDALQEIFLRVFHKGRSLRDPGRLRSFVVAVTLHFIRSEFRKRRVRRLIRLWPEARMPEPEGVVHPSARLALNALYRALDTLPTNERMAFTLRFFEGQEITAAAALAGTSMATFKRRLLAAKRRLWTMTGEDPWLAPYLADDGGAQADEGSA